MAPDSADSLVALLDRHAILDESRMGELKRVLSRAPGREAATVTREMVRRHWLTQYQADELLRGDVRNLIVGSYVILDRLGEGGMGEVFRARHVRLGRDVAVKRMRPTALTSNEAVRRFRREVELAGRVNHPNVVRALDAEEADGSHLLIMEYVAGRDLARVVKTSHPIPVAVVCRWMIQVGLGLQHAHELGLVHRDIKPSNLILTEDGATVKILDLGLARVDTRTGPANGPAITRLGAVIGTPDFISPEQALNPSKVDPRSDLYSLGCTFYLLLTKRVPFPGGTPAEKIMRHQLDECDPVEKLRPDVPPAVAAVVRGLMVKDPDARFLSAEAFVAALTEVAEKPPLGRPAQPAAGKKVGNGPAPAKTDLGARIDDLWRAGLAGSSVGLRAVLHRAKKESNWRNAIPAVALTLLLGAVIAVLWPGRPSYVPEPPPIIPPPPPDRSMVPKETDLLRLVDPERDRVRGGWALDNGALTVSADDVAVLKVPFEPGGEYVLRLSVTRVPAENVGAFMVAVVAGGREVSFAIDREGGTRSGLELVDGARSSIMPEPHEVPFLPFDKECEIVVSVRRQGVRASIDDVRVAEFEGDLGRLSVPADELPAAPGLYLAASKAAVRVTAISYKTLGAAAKAADE